MRSHEFPFAILVAAPLLLNGAASEARDLKAVIADMGGVTCPHMSDLTCVEVDVPIDHNATGGGTIKIEYAIHFATEQSKGVLFYVVGGPGESGIAEAKPWLKFYHDNDDSDRLRKNMDVVFFDQRGIRLSNGLSQPNGLTCPNAQTRFEMAQPSIARPDEAIAIAKAYATDCPAEFKSRALLNVLDTQQAIRDLEQFRQAIGSPKVLIYGYSYGTQFAQQYATAFPDAVKGVIIDGVVDLTLDYDDYENTAVLAAEDILTRVLKACGAIDGPTGVKECGEDMNGDAVTVYKTLAAKAAEKPIEVEYTLENGTPEKRQLTRNMLETTAYEALYTPDDRAEFLRDLAAASRDNRVPLLDLSYRYLNVNPQTLESLDDGAEATYYAITCSEYGEKTADGDATAWRIMEQAKALSTNTPQLPEFLYMERLVCAFWSTPGPTQRPKPYAGGDFPTLIINADADPITPLSMSQSVLGHAKKASMIRIANGPHASWGYGDTCVDEPVYDLLLNGTTPTPGTVTPCEQHLIGEYTKLTLTEKSSANDASAVAAAVETELRQERKLGKGDQKNDLKVGCDFGGTMTVSGSEDLREYGFAGCAWWPGIVLDGSATRAGAKGSESLKLNLAISGEHSGKINYWRDVAATAGTLSGEYDGKEVTAP